MTDPTPPWTARTGEDPAADLVSYGECVDVDEALIAVDLAGSIAHVAGLHEANLVTQTEATSLVEGLQTLAEQAEQDTWQLEAELEDVHMNVEHQLREVLGPVADKLHTARSRNDQVALDVVLFTRQGLVELASNLHALAHTLATTASEHVKTPWPLHTHRLPGQPATLGYLLHAHALRLHRDALEVLNAFHTHEESPLGAGAGAGSTLPIDPALSASLLGLKPPKNGLLATSARDGSIRASQLAATAGHHVQDLAVDLLALAQAKAIELPAAYTTGSSIMPHKTNPDALELARADAGKLASLADQVQRIASGLGLGYDRDLQRAKPPLVEALSLAPQMLAVVDNLVASITVDEDVLAQMQATEGVATTDAVEALVDQGVAFRRAHQIVAEACHTASQEDLTIASALKQQLASEGLDAETIEAARDGLEGDPSHRDTRGGPAPHMVAAQLQELQSALGELSEQIDEAAHAAEAPLQLLEQAPATLVEAPMEGQA